MHQEATTFRQLLLSLFDRNRRCFDSPSPRIALILEKIPLVYRRITESSILERHLPGTSLAADLWDVQQFLYLQPIEQGRPTIPILTVKCDFSKSHPLVSIRLILFLLDESDNIQMLGYRFETPHGDGEGRHDFYHVQPIINVIGPSSGPRLNCPEWIPDTHPSFALDAENSVMLMLCLLLSLYGLGFIRELGNNFLGGTTLGFSENAHFMKFPPTFWRVAVGQKSFFYKTWHKPPRFKSLCSTLHQGKPQYSPITSLAYYSQAARETI